MFIRPCIQLGGGPDSSIPFSGLVSWWPLDETTGTRFDSHGSNHLDVVNALSFRSAVVGNGADFNGTTSYLSKVSPTNLGGGAESFCFCAWMNYDAVTSLDALAASLNGTTVSNWNWMLIFELAAGLRFYTATGSTKYSVISSSPVSITTDYFIYVEYDHALGRLGISVNGGALDTTSGVPTPNNGAHPITLGAAYALGYYSNGVIDEAAYWRGTTLSSAQITWLYNGGAGRSYAEVSA